MTGYAIQVNSNTGFNDEQEGWVVWCERIEAPAAGTNLNARPYWFATRSEANRWINHQPDALFDRFALEIVEFPVVAEVL